MKNAGGKLILLGLLAIPAIWVVLWKVSIFESNPLPMVRQLSDSVYLSKSPLQTSYGDTYSFKSKPANITIVSFFSTSCKKECPVVCGHVKILSQKLVNSIDIKFLSISLDPLADSLTKLKQFATAYEVDSSQWTLVTGDPNELHNIAINAFDVPEKMDIEDGSVEHSTTLYLLDKNGQIRGTYNGLRIEEVLEMETDARYLLRNSRLEEANEN